MSLWEKIKYCFGKRDNTDNTHYINGYSDLSLSQD